MLNLRKVSKHKALLESELEQALKRLSFEMPHTEGYRDGLTIVERLYELMDDNKSTSVSRETLATIAANLAGIILIIKHESVNVITSKAMSFVTRLK